MKGVGEWLVYWTKMKGRSTGLRTIPQPEAMPRSPAEVKLLIISVFLIIVAIFSNMYIYSNGIYTFLRKLLNYIRTIGRI